MDYETLILDKLLDKYEERVATSNRRVRIILDKNEVKVPNIESSKYIEFREAMLRLKNKDFINVDWVRKDYIIKSIWLNLDNVDTVYHYLERQTRNSKATVTLNIIETALQKITAKWIKEYLKAERDNILVKWKITGIWCKEQKIIFDFLAALEGIDKLNGNAVHMRVFSINAYGDSKKFEKEVKQLIIPIIKRFEPNLVDVEEISERGALAQVGIIMMPETFEFCGNVKINFKSGEVDFSPMLKGSCISSECVSDICNIEIFNTDKIIFIENKTNYSEYCLNSRSERELVVYHGGFYSPQRGEFFRKLCAMTNLPVYFWGDIDYGGFKMCMRLKNNIISSIQPLNMDLISYNRYKSKGLSKGDEYIAKLSTLKTNEDYYEFFDVIDAIIAEKTTVEQEAFLDYNIPQKLNTKLSKHRDSGKIEVKNRRTR